MVFQNFNKNLKDYFITNKDNKPVYIYTLKNKNGIEARITNYGCKLISLNTPDKFGELKDIVLGYDNIEEYFNKNPYFGAIVGRYANRIKKGKFKIDNTEYQLTKNLGDNHLHGGNKGFQDKVWDVVETNNNKICSSISFAYLSKHLEEGYPGNLHVKVSYTLNDQNEMIIEYFAETDKPTIINLTHHSFFNLQGEGSGSILDHLLEINADKYIEVDQDVVPTGEIKSVENTPLDFRKSVKIGSRINENFDQLKYGGGYDHSFVLKDKKSVMQYDAKVIEPESGRCMEVITTKPGLHLYTGNFLSKSEIGKGGKIYNRQEAFCLETQHFADSPNHPDFPSTILKMGETYKHKTIYRFLVNKY